MTYEEEQRKLLADMTAFRQRQINYLTDMEAAVNRAIIAKACIPVVKNVIALTEGRIAEVRGELALLTGELSS